MDHALEMRHIYKRFPGVTALNDVNIVLHKGEILSIVGENGAGKSTLMKILSGVYPAGTYEGEIFVNGQEFAAKNVKMAEGVGIAMISQELNVELDLSVSENILLGRWPHKRSGLIDWNLLHQQARESLRELNVDIDPRLSMRLLSASLQQLVCIARALIQKPRILILDEPTAALTENETENLMGIIRNLKSNGISCIYISHKLEEVFDISNRVVTMRDARVISEYTREEIVPDRIIDDIIGRHVERSGGTHQDMSETVLLEVRNISVPHPYALKKKIIEDVSFSLHKGEILGLAGLMGSGRSELLKAVFGVTPKLGGTIYVDGKEQKITSSRDAIENGVSMLSEDRKFDGLVSTMNIKDNMTLSSLKKITDWGFINRKRESEQVKQYFDYLRIKAKSPEVSIIALSGGNQQKTILAKCLMTEAKILFLDEPTRGIDIGAKHEIYKIIRELAEEGVGIVVISSELPELETLCDRFLVLANGHISAEFTSKNVSQNALLHAAAFGSNEQGSV